MTDTTLYWLERSSVVRMRDTILIMVTLYSYPVAVAVVRPPKMGKG